MLNKSRSDIYNYLYNLFYGTVTENVYSMNEPQELERSDIEEGFLVLHVGNVYDDSEFDCEAYGRARCFVEAFIPPLSRGRVDIEKYRAFEESIDSVIDLARESATNEQQYYIQSDGILSSEAEETSNANNIFFVFVKSFIVLIDKNNN